MFKRVSGEFALHVQMPWRLRGERTLVAGLGDYFRLPDGGGRPSKPDVPNRLDARLFPWARVHLPMTISAVSLDALGGFTLALENEYYFETFYDESLDSEKWSLFRPAEDDDPMFNWYAPVVGVSES